MFDITDLTHYTPIEIPETFAEGAIELTPYIEIGIINSKGEFVSNISSFSFKNPPTGEGTGAWD